MDEIEKLPLNAKWDMYCHLPNNDDWSLSGYRVVFRGISTVEDTIALSETIPDAMLRLSMIFVMRSGVAPMWEDPRNKSGGSFSFKVPTRQVPEMWTQMMFAALGGCLFRNPRHADKLTGITISPKKNFSILKVWMTDCSLQDASILSDLPGLSKERCLFLQHGAAAAAAASAASTAGGTL